MMAALRSRGLRLMQVLLLCALLLRVAVPAGWMPEAQAGTVRITLCNAFPGGDSFTRAQALLENALGDADHGKDRAGPSDQPCAFAGLYHSLAEPPLPLDILPPASAAEAKFAIESIAVQPGRGLAAPPPPATGPPLLA